MILAYNCNIVTYVIHTYIYIYIIWQFQKDLDKLFENF